MAGRVIDKEVGLVVASAFRAKNLPLDMLAAIGSLFGGEVSAYNDLVSDCVSEASRRLMNAAEDLGATSVVCVRLETTSTMNRFVFGLHVNVVAYGTAVVDRPADGEGGEEGEDDDWPYRE